MGIRGSVRFRGDGSIATITYRGRSASGAIYDESLSGVSICLDRFVEVETGETVTLGYYGFELPAIVRRISPQSNGQLILGFEWPKSTNALQGSPAALAATLELEQY